jgi:YHS domain-containing protein
MKKFIAIALLATTLAACSAEHAPAAENSDVTEVVDVSAVDVAEVSDDVKVPVFTGPAGSEAIGISGYDAVSYFVGDGTPTEGSNEHRVRYNGVEYHFANAENAATFQAEPAKYAPQYGGHCAWAASNGKLAPGDPKLAKVVDGKLYLNFNETVQETWNKDIPGFIEKADKEFPKISPDARFDDA